MDCTECITFNLKVVGINCIGFRPNRPVLLLQAFHGSVMYRTGWMSAIKWAVTFTKTAESQVSNKWLGITLLFSVPSVYFPPFCPLQINTHTHKDVRLFLGARRSMPDVCLTFLLVQSAVRTASLYHYPTSTFWSITHIFTQKMRTRWRLSCVHAIHMFKHARGD